MNVHVDAAARGAENHFATVFVARLDEGSCPVECWRAPDVEAAHTWIEYLQGQEPGSAFAVYASNPVRAITALSMEELVAELAAIDAALAWKRNH